MLREHRGGCLADDAAFAMKGDIFDVCFVRAELDVYVNAVAADRVV